MHELISFARDNPGWTLIYLIVISSAVSNFLPRAIRVVRDRVKD